VLSIDVHRVPAVRLRPRRGPPDPGAARVGRRGPSPGEPMDRQRRPAGSHCGRGRALREGAESMMRVHVLETSDPEWSHHLAGSRHDVFHVPAFVHAEDRFRGTVSRLVVVEDGESALLVPLVFSTLPDGLVDASSPHGPAGPVFSEGTTETWRRAAVTALIDHLHERDVVSLFLRAHPL